MSERRPFTITCVERCDDGYWTAHVTSDGRTFKVDRKPGSWRLWDQTARGWREVLPHVAKALQDRVRPLERKAVAA